MRRLALLCAGAAIWLLLAVVPVLADGGVHIAASNSGFSTLTADGCAGCHRAHTAQGEYLLRAANANGLCLTCHGASGTGATADVMTGVQYKLTTGARDTGTQIGALRDGGFDQARINSSNPSRYTYLRTATDASFRAKVSVSNTPTNVTSAHLDLDGAGGVTAKDVAWGNGVSNSGAGPTVEIECTSCHNPHGNGQYRILNTLPAATGTGFADPVSIPISGVSATTDRFTTTEAHGLIVGDIVTITGVSGASYNAGATGFVDGQYIVKSIPNGVTFTVALAPTKTSADITGAALDFWTNGSGGAVKRYAAIVDDAPLPVAGDERNYTVLQVRGYQGSPSTYLLYASDVLDARLANSFDLVADVVGATASNDRFVTGLAHGFAIGDTVTIAGGTAYDGAYCVKSIPGSTSFTLYTSTVCSGATLDVTANLTMGVNGTRTISAVDATTDTITTSAAHTFAVGDPVQFNGGPAPLANGTTYYVKTSATPNLQVSATKGGPVLDITATTTGGTVFSRIGTATKTVAGTFSSTSGDYFHRTVPWNPVAINPSCPNTVVIDSTANPDLASACLTANDAPNGRPATVSGMVKVNTSGAANVAPSAYGQVAFNDQISAWCSTCHSRYYSSTNPNPGTDPGSSDFPARTIASIDLPSDAITVGPTITNADGTTSTITSSGYANGDMVQFVATPTAPNLSSGTWYVVYVGSSATSDAMSFKVSATYDGPPVDITGWSGGGTVVRLAPASASSWWFPRPNEPIYKYQHQTTTNRACVTCHVSHGSNAAMPGDQSGVVTYPGDPSGSLTTLGYNSRLLKVDNRGTCQMCHDPTGTWTAGQFLPLNGTPPTVP